MKNGMEKEELIMKMACVELRMGYKGEYFFRFSK